MSKRKFGPKNAAHPSIGRLCPVCNIPFHEGDYTSLVATKPASEEDAEKQAQGRPYTAEAEEIHYSHIEDSERFLNRTLSNGRTEEEVANG